MDYEALLKRAKEQLPEVQDASERYEVPRVKGHIQGNATIISNFNTITDALGRPQKHVLKVLNKELAAKGVIKQDQFLIFNTKLPASRINEKIDAYTEKYVLCNACGKPETVIEKVGQAVFMRCNACGSKNPIKG